MNIYLLSGRTNAAFADELAANLMGLGGLTVNRTTVFRPVDKSGCPKPDLAAVREADVVITLIPEPDEEARPSLLDVTSGCAIALNSVTANFQARKDILVWDNAFHPRGRSLDADGELQFYQQHGVWKGVGRYQHCTMGLIRGMVEMMQIRRDAYATAGITGADPADLAFQSAVTHHLMTVQAASHRAEIAKEALDAHR
jgi:hypothetical protein